MYRGYLPDTEIGKQQFGGMRYNQLQQEDLAVNGYASSGVKGFTIAGQLRGYIVLPVMLVVLLVLSACASLSEEECLAADWYTIGVEDGAKGQPMQRIGAHRKACAEVGVQPDMDRYSQGRDFGLQSFCTRERGYREGEAGRSYNGVCPPHLEGTFMQGYLAGQEKYRIKQDIRRLETELATVRKEVAEIRAALDNGYTVDDKGVKNPVTKYERDAMYERLLALGKEEGRLEGAIASKRTELIGA